MRASMLTRAMEMALNTRSHGAIRRLLECRTQGIHDSYEIVKALADGNYPFTREALVPFFEAGIDPTELFVRFCDSRLLGGLAMRDPRFDSEEAMRRFMAMPHPPLMRVTDLSTFVQLLPPSARNEVLHFFATCDGAVTQPMATALIMGGVAPDTKRGRQALFEALRRPVKRDLALALISNSRDVESPFDGETAQDSGPLATPLMVAVKNNSMHVAQQLVNRLPKTSLDRLVADLSGAPERDVLNRLIEARRVAEAVRRQNETSLAG